MLGRTASWRSSFESGSYQRFFFNLCRVGSQIVSLYLWSWVSLSWWSGTGRKWLACMRSTTPARESSQSLITALDRKSARSLNSRLVAYFVVILLKSRQGALVSWVLMPVALYNEDQGFLISPQNNFLTEHILVVMHHAKNWDKKLLLDLGILPLCQRKHPSSRYHWLTMVHQ